MSSSAPLSWRKLGRVYTAQGEGAWQKTHAFVPTAIIHDKQTIRVYASFLDDGKYGRVGFVDVDIKDPRRVIQVSREPALDLGSPGNFDDSGVTPTKVLDWEGKRLLYYNGWQRSHKVPYVILTGLAISEDQGATFKRVRQTPILERTDYATIVRSTPEVIPPDGGSPMWRMWYSAGSRFLSRDGHWAPIYGLRYAESSDGINWRDHGTEVLSPREPDEFGLTRPAVWPSGTMLHMLYSCRSQSRIYSIEHALSTDGVTWHRQDGGSGVNPSDHGWDSEMVAFPSLVRTGEDIYLFYNGNGYGREGFGVAVYDGPVDLMEPAGNR